MNEWMELLRAAAEQARNVAPAGLRPDIEHIWWAALARVQAGEDAETVLHETTTELERLLADGRCVCVLSHYAGSIHDAAASLDIAADELIALEKHCVSPHRWCKRCAQKHARGAKIFLEEAVSLSDGAPRMRALAAEGLALQQLADSGGDWYALGAAGRALRRKLI